MKPNKTLIHSVIALMLAISMTLSLSSCTLVYDMLEQMLFGDEYGDQDVDPTPDENGGNDDQKIPEINVDDSGSEFLPGSGENDTSAINPAKKAMLSVVSIIAKTQTSASYASGVFCSVDKNTGDAYIITNYHVIYDNGYASAIKVYLYGMHLETYAISATIVGGSLTNDIALLKVTGSDVIKNSYATAATFADSDSVRIFDRVYAIGNSEAKGLSVTEGIVSAESESTTVSGADGSTITLRVMRTDAPVNHGNSGGGLFDSQGRLIGIVTAKEISSDIENMGYAIPSNLVLALVNNILRNCEGSSNMNVLKPIMGITITSYVSGLVVDPESGDFYEANLVEIIEVSKTSPAYGMAKVGDVIEYIIVDGRRTEVYRSYQVTDSMFYASSGSEIRLGVLRNGEPIELIMTITPDAVTVVK